MNSNVQKTTSTRVQLFKKSGIVQELPRPRDDTDRCVYDVLLVERTDLRVEDTTNDINTYSTGIVLTPPKGYYIEVFLNQELLKQGYMMPGSVIIESGNSQELIVPLFKFKDSEDLSLPCDGVAFVIKESHPNIAVHLVTKNSVMHQPNDAYSRSGNNSYSSGSYQPDFEPGQAIRSSNSAPRGSRRSNNREAASSSSSKYANW